MIDGNYTSDTYGILVNSSTGLTNVTVKNLKVTDWIYGIYYYNVSEGNIENNNPSSNLRGITFGSSSNNTLTNNNASNNHNGILISGSLTRDSGYNIITNNTASNNYRGIEITPFSDSNTITNNTASSNYYGIQLDTSANNTIYNNYFNNTVNFYFEFIIKDNKWNTTKQAGNNIIGGPYLGGNFWATPGGTGFSETCSDAVGNGICDSNYTLASGNVDYLPLSLNFTAVTTPPTNLTITYNNDGSITLDWNGSAESYDIFITNNYSAGFDPSPNVTGITDKNWTDENASLHNQRYYRVGASGGVAGDETVGKFDIELYPGLNFVSLPLIPHNSSTGNVTHQNASFYPVTEIASLNASGDYDIATFYPENPPEYWWSSDNFTALENDKGFWFNVTQDYNFTLVGEVPTSNRSSNLTQGFNLVGWTSLEERKLWNAANQSSSDYNVTEIASLSASGEYTISTFYPGNSPNYWWSADNFNALEPSKGYWFKVNQTFVWNYAP